MSSDLTTQTCKPCENGAGKLDPHAIADLARQIPGWEVINDGGGEIRRTFKFKNYYESTAFVNATAWISHRQDHHPDIELGYNKVTLRYSTHSAGGLTQNDFICAAKINALLAL